MPEIPGQLITYCTNIHPGESWAETFSGLARHIPAVKAAVTPKAPFPIGLRLSNRAAMEMNVGENARFSDWLVANDCFVPTINGFPYGAFHGERIKENVYQPDWRSPERVAYTRRLADLLSGWLPAGMAGSISTVPLGFKGIVDSADLPIIKRHIIAVLEYLFHIEQERGQRIILALEPEPGCLIETTPEACRFFEELALSQKLSRFLGVCYDCCHQAVQFEEPATSLAQLADAGIGIAKVQVSSALSLSDQNPARLERFIESCYLHQVVVRRRDGILHRYTDLPDALTRHPRTEQDEWRCHFHFPIFIDNAEDYGTTRFFLEKILPLLPPDILLEVETYTWDVLPPDFRCESVTDSIIRELKWLEATRSATHRCS